MSMTGSYSNLPGSAAGSRLTRCPVRFKVVKWVKKDVEKVDFPAPAGPVTRTAYRIEVEKRDLRDEISSSANPFPPPPHHLIRMSRPPIDPDKTAAGIIVDPQSLDRVVPESRRADGSYVYRVHFPTCLLIILTSVRKEIKIRPGFTPQEDVKRFRGTRQAQMDASALPKGHIVGWAPPTPKDEANKPMSKSAKKNAKRREKRDEKKATVIKDSWEDDDEPAPAPKKEQSATSSTPPATSSKSDDQPSAETLAEDLDKLKVES
jgi:partner of Y14 and mago